MKRITALFLSILLLLSLCVTALGHEAPDLTKKGTITIQWMRCRTARCAPIVLAR